VGLGDFALVAGGGDGALEAKIVGEVEREQIAGAVDGIAGLEGVVEANAQGVGGAEIVDVALVAEAERLEVGGEGAAVDGRDVAEALGGFRDVAVADSRGEQVAEAVDFPEWVFVVPRGAGAERGVEADFAEGAGVGGFGDERGVDDGHADGEKGLR
jgi:hypothetical protein